MSANFIAVIEFCGRVQLNAILGVHLNLFAWFVIETHYLKRIKTFDKTTSTKHFGSKLPSRDHTTTRCRWFSEGFFRDTCDRSMIYFVLPRIYQCLIVKCKNRSLRNQEYLNVWPREASDNGDYASTDHTRSSASYGNRRMSRWHL